MGITEEKNLVVLKLLERSLPVLKSKFDLNRVYEPPTPIPKAHLPFPLIGISLMNPKEILFEKSLWIRLLELFVIRT